MFAKIARSFAKSDTIKATKYVQDHAIMTNRQLDMMRDQINGIASKLDLHIKYNALIITGITGFFGYIAYTFDKNNDKRFEQVDKRFEQVDKRLDKIEYSIENLTKIIINNNK